MALARNSISNFIMSNLAPTVMEVVPFMDVSQKQAQCSILSVGIKMDPKTNKEINSIFSKN